AKAEAASSSSQKEVLIEQATSADANTGHEDFDKLIRALAVNIEAMEKMASDAAVKAAGAFQDHLIRVCQFEYMYHKGKADGLKEAANLPLQILNEKKLTS
ncbi:MAG: hypothetical protein ACRD2L_22625, partial [Terriglobia bacterium]